MNHKEEKKYSESKAIAWSAVERFSAQGIQFVLGIVIARLLTPSSYGLVAMLSIFLAIGQSLIDSGFGSALIQKKNCTQSDYSTVFYFNIVVSVILYLICFVASPYIAAFYNEPQLESITKVSTLVFIINALAIVQRTKLTKNLDFKSQSKATIISTITSGLVGIFLAYKGFGAWALVVQGLVSSSVSTLVLWIISRWRPSLIFSTVSFKTLFGFGSRLIATGLLQTIYVNLYTLVIGKFYNARDLGFFNKMQNFATFPSRNFTSIVARAVYPEQCKLQDNNEALLANYLKLLSLSSFVIFPLMMGLAALSKPFINVLLGEKWIEGSTYLMILCFAYMLDPIQYFNWQILSVKGRSDLSLKSEVIKKIVSILIMVITIPMGVEYMICGLAFYAICDLAIIIPFVHKVLPQITYMLELRTIFKPLLISLTMFAVILTIEQFIDNKYLQLIIPFICGCAVFFLISLITKSRELNYFLDKLRRFYANRK